MNSYSRHELLDRVSILADMLDCYVLSHPAITREWSAQAASAQAILNALYQSIGAEHFK